MCHLIRRAKLKRKRTLRLNVIKRSLEPVELITKDIALAVESYCNDFGRLVTASGAALDMIADAELTLTIRPGRVVGRPDKNLYAMIDAAMLIVDDRGKEYLAHHSEEYVCEPLR